jgi:WD40 repeat protein
MRLGSGRLWQIPLPRGVGVGSAAWDLAGRRLAVADGDLLTVLEPWQATRPLQFRFPGLVFLAGWQPHGHRLRFKVLDEKIDTTRWWDLTDGDRTAHPLPNLSPNPREQDGAWTSDGRFFVFDAEQDGTHQKTQVWVAGGDPFRSYRVTTDAFTWRGITTVPGSKTMLAFGRQHQGQLVTLSSEGSAVFGKLLLRGVPAFELDYSRDGKWVAYTLFPELTIWRCRLDGSEARQLSPSGIEAYQPHWSPDGTRIAFMGKRGGSGTKWRVYLVPSPGGAVDEPLPDGDDQGVPTWSPDGRSLIFGDRKTPVGFERATIHKLDLQTRTVSAIAAPIGMWTPRMSPDGKHLAAIGYDNKSLYVRDNQRGTWRKCVTMNLVEEPVWPLDSSWIQFIGNPRPSRIVLYRVSPNCEQPREVADLSDLKCTGDTWVGVTPDHSACALLQVPDEIYALDWRLRRRLP